MIAQTVLVSLSPMVVIQHRYRVTDTSIATLKLSLFFRVFSS